jgi:hypothetical protein
MHYPTANSGKLFGIVVLFTVIVFVSALQVNAETFTFTGKVVLTDKESPAIAIAPFDKSLTGVFALSSRVSITMGRDLKSLYDIDAGDLVTVTYHRDSNGINIVDRIVITSRASEEQAYIILRNG